LSPGRQAWELKANASFRSAEGPRAARKRGATWKDRPKREARSDPWKDRPQWSALSLRFQVPQQARIGHPGIGIHFSGFIPRSSARIYLNSLAKRIITLCRTTSKTPLRHNRKRQSQTSQKRSGEVDHQNPRRPSGFFGLEVSVSRLSSSEVLR
jgi:hypothetical protein